MFFQFARHSSAAALGALFISQFATALPAQAERFAFDQKRTEVRFVYTMGLATQRGVFSTVTGSLDFDEAQPEKSKVTANIATASLSTGQPIIDNTLKGSSFFNVSASPAITFKSKSVQAGGEGVMNVAGDITVNGITKPVTLKVSLKPRDPALKHSAGAKEFTATTRIQRSAFNMTDFQSMVADEVDIEIIAIVRPQK
jgi:polyisoprenoid-binding protein YceI